MSCRQCGKILTSNDQFCSSCGLPQSSTGASTGSASHQHQQVHNQSYGYHPEGNTFAVVGLILAFFQPLFGLIFSAIGLSVAGKRNGAGKGMAIAGLVISIVWLVVVIIMITIIIANGPSWFDNWNTW